MDKCICNFCGRSDREVAKMIVSKNCNICDECVQQCVCILLDESRENSLNAKRDREKKASDNPGKLFLGEDMP